MKIQTLLKRAGEEILREIEGSWPPNIDYGSAKGIRVLELEEGVQLFYLEKIKALKLKESIVPFLDQEEVLVKFPKVVVDSGAVKYVCNGADVMRPGITSFDDAFSEGNLVVVVDVKYRKYLAIGRALFSSVEAQAAQKGAVVRNLHYVGDRNWVTGKEAEIS